MAGRVSGKTAIVFGAGSSGPGWGNGKAAAVLYAREGAAVACVDISAEAAAETAGIIAAEGGRALAIAADVTDLASVEDAAARAMAAFGAIDILHNNVGVVVPGGPEELDEAGFQRGLDLNVGSVYRTAKVLLPHFRERRAGSIVNISSLAAIRWTGYPYFAYYAAKAAVVQATVAIALQYAPHGVRANAVLPGLIDTPLIYAQISANYASAEEMVAARNRAVPLGKMGTAWDVAAAAVFLASDEAKFITGVALPVDGGQSQATPVPH
ncbi:SDR family oxidoreductase [Alsobacter sp. SYSU M60028]|uniref:SDR family oxidoreductase n=1 Tax=Alsobacter ponti TaxID=2962936 RepID=A0ABT1L9X8_9HYPH|nr:SDR family oxidoreductase [Alsobacter ponti]MCP8937901.1 SDR family oxidoreductase [Alsobacter ponti]